MACATWAARRLAILMCYCARLCNNWPASLRHNSCCVSSLQVRRAQPAGRGSLPAPLAAA